MECSYQPLVFLLNDYSYVQTRLLPSLGGMTGEETTVAALGSPPLM